MKCKGTESPPLCVIPLRSTAARRFVLSVAVVTAGAMTVQHLSSAHEGVISEEKGGIFKSTGSTPLNFYYYDCYCY